MYFFIDCIAQIAIFATMSTQKSLMVHLYNSAPAQRVGQEEMDMLERLSAFRGGASKASVLRDAVRKLYEFHEGELPASIRKIKYKQS